MSKSKRDLTPGELPPEPSYHPADDNTPEQQATPEPAPKPRQQFSKELAELKKTIAAVLELIDLADDAALALPDEAKSAMYQRAISKLRGLV